MAVNVKAGRKAAFFIGGKGDWNLSLKMLWKLQEIDLAIKEIENEIENSPLRREAEEAAERLADRDQDLDEAEQALREQRKKLKRGELDLETIASEHSELHQRLYSGEVKNIKELEQMELKLRSVSQNQLTVEEELLSMMESIEEMERQIEFLAVQKKETAADLQQRRRRLDEKLANLGGDLENLQGRREDTVAQIEPRYLERYRELAGRYHGRGLARVIKDICQGCNVFISSAQRVYLYDPQAMVYCESCGRLLVRFTEEELQDEEWETVEPVERGAERAE